MNWLNVFKLYNIKKLKNEKGILIFTAVSIFITTLISLLVPQITMNNKQYMDKSIQELNGGDLMIEVKYPSKKFNSELKTLIKEGYKVSIEGVENSYYRNISGEKSIGKLILGENNIGKNEIVLYKSIANNIKAKVGDKIEIESSKIGRKKYIVKEIEDIPCGVDNDSKVLGYGKIFSGRRDGEYIKSSSLVFINGGDGESLKQRLKNIEDGYVYTSLKDRKKSVQGDVDKEIASFSVITSMAYILSIITIITTTIMILLRRKNDFAILKMLSIPGKSLKRALLLELSLIITIPVIVAAMCSFKISTIILLFKGTKEMITSIEKIKIILNGVIFNLLLFFIFLNIALIMLKSIKPLSVMRENEVESKKIRKRITKISIISVPVVLFAYSLYVGRLSTFGGGCLILLFIGIFLAITISLLKIIRLIPFKNRVLIYGFNSIKKNFTSFTMIILSITMTIVFLLVGFTLDKRIKDSMNNTMKNKLPYDHILIQDKNNVNIEKKLTNNRYIDKYSKFYGVNGKIINSDIKSKSITVNKVKKEDYKAKYRILDGKGIFEGNKNEVLISDKYKKINKLNIGDFINIETIYGNFKYKIKGIYDGGEFNSETIIKEYDNDSKAEKISFIINSNSDKWINDISCTGKCYVVSVDSLSSSISYMLNNFLDIFKYLCFLCIFSSLLFNMNMVYMNYLEDKKDETIIIALGIGKNFCIKYQLFKLILLVIVSTIMSFGTYMMVVKLGLKLLINSNAHISVLYLIISIIISLILSVISFNFPIRSLRKETSYDLLKV